LPETTGCLKKLNKKIAFIDHKQHGLSFPGKFGDCFWQDIEQIGTNSIQRGLWASLGEHETASSATRV
jgi:hypothetical protein